MDVSRVRDHDVNELARLLGRFELRYERVDDAVTIPGSYWGDSEAGLIGSRLYACDDTPIHSVLHESAHFVCMTPERRHRLSTDAGGDDAEEDAVCYLQVLCADHLVELDRGRLFEDMDRWGYSFRLGSTERWFREDADDARRWLFDQGLIDTEARITWARRGEEVSRDERVRQRVSLRLG